MNPDFVALLRELSAADARFLIVGAYALAHHARPEALIRNKRALGRPRDLADLEALGV